MAEPARPSPKRKAEANQTNGKGRTWTRPAREAAKKGGKLAATRTAHAEHKQERPGSRRGGRAKTGQATPKLK